MKLTGLSKAILTAMLLATIASCQPEVEEPSIDNCLVAKIDGIEVVPLLVNGQPSFSLVGNSTVFTYEKGMPVRFSYYINSELTGYTTVSYNSDGTLRSGIDYDENNRQTGRIEYLYDRDKELIQESVYNTEGDILNFTGFEYNSDGMPSLATTVRADYDNLFFDAFTYRYEYDENKNVTRMSIRYLGREYDFSDDFFEDLLDDVEREREFLAYTCSGYDDKYNPYRSQPTLAVLFDDLPAYNNAKTITYHYRDTGNKYADLTYTYEYNRKGFPYIYTTKVDYTDQYTRNTGITDYTNTSSFEYVCQ